MHSIRSRLIIVFIICILAIGGLTGFYYYDLYNLEKKIVLVEQFDDFRDNILELRRYEKNYFLTGKSIHMEQMEHYLKKTQTSFLDIREKIKGILDSSEYDKFVSALKEYLNIIKQYDKTAAEGSFGLKALQPRGKILSSFSEKLITAKRSRIAKVLRHMLIIPLAFNAGFIFLVLVVMTMAREDILKPLALIQSAAENVSKGVFKPIDHTTTQKNEVSHCIAAFNKMVVEIDTGQDQLLQSRKMASIGTFTSGIAHELNNPINNISLIVDSLLEDGESLSSEMCTELYIDLMDQADRASEIVRNLLEFSRTEQDHFENISLKDMIKKTQRLLRNELSIKRVKFLISIQEDLPKVWIDKSHLQQALVNLLLNGIHAMPDGGNLTLEVVSVPDSGEIRIDIKDTGIGIPKEQLSSIFDPFFTTKKEGEGTGLGLSVTYNIIQRHRGKIVVESTLGRGTCFSIFLPIKA